MRVTLRYFAGLREAVGIDGEVLELPPGTTTVGAVRELLKGRGEPWARELAEGRNIRSALDQRMAAADAPVVEGAELAFFPPVTGG